MTNKKIKVLLVADNLDIGGAQSFIMFLFKNLNKNLFDIDFAVSTNKIGFFEEEVNASKSKIYHLCSPIKHFFQYRKQLKKIIKENNYDVVHCHLNFLSFVPLSCCDKKIITICHAHASYPSSGFISRLFRRFFKKWVRKHCKYLLGCSKKSCKWLYGSNATYEVIENEVDANKYKFNASQRFQTRRELGVDDNCFVFVNVGNLEPIKRQETLIDAFSKVCGTEKNKFLIILGDGSLMKTLKDRIKALNIEGNVMLLGKKSDVASYLSAADCFVFSSLYEGSPMCLLEAKANGLPCLVSGTLELSDSLEKYVVKTNTNDIDSFAKQMTAISAHKRIFKNSTSSSVVSSSLERIEAIYRNLL